MRYSYTSTERFTAYGVRLIRMGSSLTSWYKQNGTGLLRNASSVPYYVARTLCRTQSSRTDFGTTRPHFLVCCPTSNTNADTGSITEPKIPISQHANASGICAGSSHLSRHNSFFRLTAPSLRISGRGVIGSRLLAIERYVGNNSACGTSPQSTAFAIPT